VKELLHEQNPITSHHLWMYSFKGLTDSFDLIKFNFEQPISDQKRHHCVDFTNPGLLHGVVIWMDYHLNSEITISSKPDTGIPTWHKQAVFMFLNFVPIHTGMKLNMETTFNGDSDGDISFNFLLN